MTLPHLFVDDVLLPNLFFISMIFVSLIFYGTLELKKQPTLTSQKSKGFNTTTNNLDQL